MQGHAPPGPGVQRQAQALVSQDRAGRTSPAHWEEATSIRPLSQPWALTGPPPMKRGVGKRAVGPEKLQGNFFCPDYWGMRVSYEKWKLSWSKAILNGQHPFYSLLYLLAPATMLHCSLNTFIAPYRCFATSQGCALAGLHLRFLNRSPCDYSCLQEFLEQSKTFFSNSDPLRILYTHFLCDQSTFMCDTDLLHWYAPLSITFSLFYMHACFWYE